MGSGEAEMLIPAEFGPVSVSKIKVSTAEPTWVWYGPPGTADNSKLCCEIFDKVDLPVFPDEKFFTGI
ncbi:MAG TPA: hypothetical protein VHV10_19995 [Ktedonobacteraceae bacterium]|jgi:hypothetical protein|nr:hypothetical protein [Ktedonobacteraceae bacterium]